MKNKKITINYAPNTILIHSERGDVYTKNTRHGVDNLHVGGSRQSQLKYMGAKKKEQVLAILN